MCDICCNVKQQSTTVQYRCEDNAVRSGSDILPAGACLCMPGSGRFGDIQTHPRCSRSNLFEVADIARKVTGCCTWSDRVQFGGVAAAGFFCLSNMLEVLKSALEDGLLVLHPA